MIPIANASTVLNLPFSPFFHRPRIILIPQTLIQKCYINTKKTPFQYTVAWNTEPITAGRWIRRERGILRVIWHTASAAGRMALCACKVPVSIHTQKRHLYVRFPLYGHVRGLRMCVYHQEFICLSLVPEMQVWDFHEILLEFGSKEEQENENS